MQLKDNEAEEYVNVYCTTSYTVYNVHFHWRESKRFESTGKFLSGNFKKSIKNKEKSFTVLYLFLWSFARALLLRILP
jgi:hypothetical protein